MEVFEGRNCDIRNDDVDKGEDATHVYKDGFKIEYFGVIDPDTFVSWLMDIPDDPVTIINTDFEVDEFHSLAESTVRVIGYFEPNSKALKEFEEAAEDFMGEIEFFAVVDTFWARSLGLHKLNEVRLYRPFEIEPVIAPVSVDIEKEFEDWVEENDDPIMQRLSLQNYFKVWKDAEEDERLIAAFVDEETPEGQEVLKLLKKVVNLNTQYADRLEIALIDADEFPMMIDEWERMFDIEIEEGPVLGLVDISEREGLWFDMDQLNLAEPKKYHSQNVEVLDSWIDQIMSGAISLEDEEPEPSPPVAQTKGKRKKSDL